MVNKVRDFCDGLANYKNISPISAHLPACNHKIIAYFITEICLLQKVAESWNLLASNIKAFINTDRLVAL